MSKTKTESTEGPLTKGFRYFFGDDAFISYARRDATEYAAALGNALLSKEYACKLDQWGSEPGKELPRRLVAALKRSSVFILISSVQAASSSSMQQEISIFKRTRRPIIAIDLDGTIRDAVWWPLIDGLHVSVETPEARQKAKLSEQILNKIINTIGVNRKIKRQRNVTIFAAAVFVSLLSLASVAGVYAAREGIEAQENARIADQARMRAKEQTELAKTAEADAKAAREDAVRQQEEAQKQTRIAEEQTKVAGNAKAAANAARNEASRQQGVAQKQTVIAKEQTKVAENQKKAAAEAKHEADKQAGIAAEARTRASELQQETQARQLVLDANQLRTEQGTKLPTAVLLATEAVQRLSDLNVEHGAAVRAFGEGLSLLRPIEWTARLNGEVRDIRFLPDGYHGLAITAGNSIYLLDFRQPSDQGVKLIASAQDIATPNSDGTAVFVIGQSTAGVWRLPDRQFIKWNTAPKACAATPKECEATLSADATLVALSGDSPELWIWRPNEPTKQADHFDLNKFRIRDMVFAGPSPSLIAISSTPSQGFTSLIQHRVWMLDPAAGKMRFFDARHFVNRIWSDPDGKQIILAGRRPRRGRGFNSQQPVEVWRWDVMETSEVQNGEVASMDGIHILESDIATLDSLDDIVVDSRTFVIVSGGRMQLIDANGELRPLGPVDVNTSWATFDGDQMLTLNGDGAARLYDWRSPAPRQPELARFTDDQPLFAGAIDSAHERAMTGSADGVVKVWRLTYPIIAETFDYGGDMSKWYLSGDGRTAARNNQGSIELWDTTSLAKISKISPGLLENFENFSLSREGQFVAGAGTVVYDSVPTSSISLYDTRSNSAVQQPIRVNGFVTDVRTANGIVLSRVYKSGDSPARLSVWNTQTGSLTWPYGQALDPDTADNSKDILLADDGTAAAVLFGNGRLGLWNHSGQLNTSAGSQERLGLFGGVNGVIVTAPKLIDDSNSADQIQSAGVAHVMKGDSLKEIATFSVREAEELRALSPDSRYIVTRPENKLLRVIDSHSGHDLLNVATSSVFKEQAFSPDSKYFAVSDLDNVIRVFDTTTWSLIAYVPMQTSTNGIHIVGTRLITTNFNRLISWRWRISDVLAAACTTVGRPMSQAECEQFFGGKQCPTICSHPTDK